MSDNTRAPKAIVEQIETISGEGSAVRGDGRDARTDAATSAPRQAKRGRKRREGDERPAGAKAAASGPAAEGGSTPASGFEDATFGFFRWLDARMWSYANSHPHAVLYGIIGFLLAVLILTIGLWSTIVIAVFVFVATVIGQMVDGDNAAVNAIRRFLDRHK